MSFEHTHLVQIGMWIKNNWYWILTAGGVLGYSMRWTWVQLIHKRYPTFNDMIVCKRNLEDALKEHETREFARTDAMVQDNKDLMVEYRKENMEAHNRIDTKIDDIKNIIINNLRDSK